MQHYHEIFKNSKNPFQLLSKTFSLAFPLELKEVVDFFKLLSFDSQKDSLHVARPDPDVHTRLAIDLLKIILNSPLGPASKEIPPLLKNLSFQRPIKEENDEEKKEIKQENEQENKKRV